MISSVELFYEPAKILGKLSEGYRTEMPEEHLAFICGLLKKYNPQKIVEIGVASGGTTAVMLNCISMMDKSSAKLFSIDLSENFYKEPSKKTGYLAEEYKKMLNKQFDHMLYTGKYAVERINDIGKDIDFLVLDTVHSLPGEILDFLAYYPYLKTGCVIVLHDTAMNHYGKIKETYATRVLLSSVTALKILCEDANIAAFIVSEETTRNIDNVFSSLMITWSYLPRQEEINLYRDFYSKHYSRENMKMFDMAVEMNQKSVQRRAEIKLAEFLKVHKLINCMKGKRVYVYGYGKYGKQFYHILEECGFELGGYIISDDQDLEENNNTVHFLSNIVLDNDRDIVFVGTNSFLWEEISEQLRRKGVTNYFFPEEGMFDFMKNP